MEPNEKKRERGERGKGKVSLWVDSRAEEPIKVFALTAEEVARALRISPRKVDELVASKELRCRRIGDLLRFRPADIEEFMQRENTDGQASSTRKRKRKRVQA